MSPPHNSDLEMEGELVESRIFSSLDSIFEQSNATFDKTHNNDQNSFTSNAVKLSNEKDIIIIPKEKELDDMFDPSSLFEGDDQDFTRELEAMTIT